MFEQDYIILNVNFHYSSKQIQIQSQCVDIHITVTDRLNDTTKMYKLLRHAMHDKRGTKSDRQYPKHKPTCACQNHLEQLVPGQRFARNNNTLVIACCSLGCPASLP